MIFMLIIGLAMAVGAMIRFYLVSWLGERVSADLRSAVFNNLVHMQPSYFESNHSGEIMSRLTTDTTLLQTLIGSSVSLAVRNALTLTGALTLMVITNLKLSLVILVAVPVTLIPILVFGRRVRKLSNRSQQTIAEVGSHAGEIFQSIKVVQSFNREAAEKAAFGHDVEQAFAVARARVRQRALLTGFAILLLMGGMVGMMWSGGLDVIEGRMTGGELGAFVFYAVMVGTAFATLSEVWGDLQRAAGAAERLMELLAETSEIADTGTLSAASQRVLSFDKAHFAYPSRPSHPALQDFSLDIEHGESVALVGPSGAGKSTVFELILRFYDPTAGAIKFGDSDLRHLSLESWREKIALVPQQPALFSGDIFYNIAYGATDPLRRQWNRRRGWHTPTTLSRRCRTAIAAIWARKECGCLVVNGNALHWPERFSVTRNSCYLMRPPARSTPRASGTCSRRSPRSCESGRPSSSPTGFQP